MFHKNLIINGNFGGKVKGPLFNSQPTFKGGIGVAICENLQFCPNFQLIIK